MWAEGLSLQGQLGPRAPRRYRPRERAWARLLRAAGRRTAEERHRTAADASPLGLARGARRQGRLAQPRQCGLVRRIWIGDVPPPRRAREEMGDSERTDRKSVV